jgi:voltage-gated sodium channel
MYGCDQYGYEGVLDRCTQPSAAPIVSAAYFVSFVLFGTMVILNLFIGVILNGMNEAQLETEALEAGERARAGDAPDLEQELGTLSDNLKSMQDQITRLQGMARSEKARR